MNPTDEAKQRAANLQRRPGTRPMSPQERATLSLETPEAPPAVQGAQQEQAPQGAPPGHPMQNVPGAAPPGERPQPRTKGEVNADLQAYNEALRQHKDAEAETEEKTEEKSSDKGYEGGDAEFEDAIWGESDILNNTPRRKKIEKRCEPMSLEDYIMKGGVTQRVPIVPGKLEPTFRSAGTDEDLEVKRMMFGMQGTDIYISNRYSLMQLTLSLYALNNQVLPDHLDREGKFDEELFNKKFEKIKKYPTQLVEDLVHNYLWFDERVKKLFNEDLGNG